MKIYAAMEKFPGEMMVIPLSLGCVINTLISQMLETGGFITGFLKNGISALIGLFILYSGTVTSFKQAGMPLCKGAVLTTLECTVGMLIGWGLNRVLEPIETLGLAPLTVITAVANSNGMIYTVLAKESGGSTDVGTVTILSLNDGPFLIAIALGATGLAEVPLISTIAVIVPLFIGMFLRNAGEEFKMLLTNGLATLPPFNGFVLGANMSLMSIVKTGAGGIVLELVTVVCTSVLTYYIHSAIRHKPDPMDMAIGIIGGNAVAVPTSVAMADPPLNPVMGVATIQVAASVVVSAVLTPLLTGCFYKKTQKKQAEISDK